MVAALATSVNDRPTPQLICRWLDHWRLCLSGRLRNQGISGDPFEVVLVCKTVVCTEGLSILSDIPELYRNGFGLRIYPKKRTGFET